jgi:hypothetical protein
MLLIAQAIVVGIFAGVGLALTTIYSRRGPMIYPVYAALVVALTLLLSRHAILPFRDRFVASLVGFLVASLMLYAVVGVLAQRDRIRLVNEGRLPATTLKRPIGFFGHSWRLGFLLAIGALVSAAAAFVSSS